MRRLTVVSNAHSDLLETRPTRVSGRRTSQMTLDLAKSIFVFALVVWGFLRYPHQHRASKLPVRNTARNLTDSLRIACATIGLGIVPLIYVATGFPRFASYDFVEGFAYAGTLMFARVMFSFRRAYMGSFAIRCIRLSGFGRSPNSSYCRIGSRGPPGF